MINLKEFEVNKMALLISVLRKYDKNEMGKKLKDRVYEILKGTPEYLNTLAKMCGCFANYPEEYRKLLGDTNFLKALESIFESDEFLILYEEALKYMGELIERWNLLKQKVDKYFSEVLGVKEEKQIKVNVVNPQFNTGTNNLKNEIFWGHSEEMKNPYYDVVYIMHEGMHCMYPYQKSWNLEQKGICHALIELATDNELRCALEGNMQSYSEGHKDNQLQRNKLLPLWCAFLGRSDSEVASLKNLEGADFSEYNRLLENENIRKMNFSDLMSFCIENYEQFSIVHKKKEDIEI